MRLVLICGIAGACGPAAPPAGPPVTFSGEPTILTEGVVDGDAAVPPSSVQSIEYHCLPVVARACGCVYSCGLGRRDGDHWVVTHEHWKTPLTATVDKWCVDGACRDAFSVEVVCKGTCKPKPAPACPAIDLTNEREPCPTARP